MAVGGLHRIDVNGGGLLVVAASVQSCKVLLGLLRMWLRGFFATDTRTVSCIWWARGPHQLTE